MAFSRILPQGWSVNQKLASAQMNQLDIDHAAAIDGAAGGTYTPSAVISIAGAGLSPTLKAATWPNFAADGGTRTFTRTFGFSPVTKLINGTLIAPDYVSGQALGAVVASRLPVPHNCTITAIKMWFQATIHVSLPTLGPGISIQRLTPRANVTTDYLNSADAGSGTPLRYTLPGTVAAYNTAGMVFLTYAPNQNNIADRTQYDFLLTVVDELGGGAIAGNVFQSMDVTFTLPDFEVA